MLGYHSNVNIANVMPGCDKKFTSIGNMELHITYLAEDIIYLSCAWSFPLPNVY